MSEFLTKVKRTGIIIGVPILSIGIISSLAYYVYIWYANQKVLVINVSNATQSAMLVGAILLSCLFNVGLTMYYAKTLKKVERLIAENCVLSDLILKQSFVDKDDIIRILRRAGIKID